MIRYFRAIIAFFCFYLPVYASGIVTSTQIGYSVSLPDNWICEHEGSQHDQFFDTTGTFQSMVAISRYDFNSAISYSTSNEWTRANFIAYLFSVQADTLSFVSLYDTVNARQNDTLWAADAYSYFFDPDTLAGDWAEYIRFTAFQKRGYEMYAIGPSADLDSNIVVYTTIMNSIVILDSADISVRYAQPRIAIAPANASASRYADLLGRSIRSHGLISPTPSIAPQIIVKRQAKRLYIAK